MRLHDRYLFRELLTPMAICLGGFTVFWISFFFLRELDTIQEKKLTLLDATEYCVASLPDFLVMLLPLLLLLAMLYALTHHARYNEITALRAAGIGLWRICLPYFAVGLAATGIYFALNEVASPRCAFWSAEILARHAGKSGAAKIQVHETKSFLNPRAHRVWRFVDYDATAMRMTSPTVSWMLPDGSWSLLRADRAARTNGVWTFYNAQLYKQSGAKGETQPVAATNVMAMPAFDENQETIRLLLKFNDTQTLHGSSTADIPLAELWEFMRNDPGLRPEDEHAFATKFHGRLATPWTCLVVVLMAIPFGAPSGRRNLFFGVAGSIFICFAYFVLQRVSLALGMNGTLPGWLAAWLPNLFFAVLGSILTLRVR
ncbi:MAG TPA: LptF/LptG family permease [Verrucomicrobiae bacterium]